MDISREFFNKNCPAAIEPSGKIFEAVSSFFPEAERLVAGVIDDAMIDSIAEEHDPNGIADIFRRFICLQALYLAVPHLDLVLTPTGFGVVSTDTVAPASAERVRSLRTALERDSGLALDELFDRLAPLTEWNTSVKAHRFVWTLFPRLQDIADITGEPVTLGLHPVWSPDINSAERNLAVKLSPELLQHLRDGVRCASLTDAEARLVGMIKGYVKAYLKHEALGMDLKLLKVVEDDIKEFPTYEKSSTYHANHFERYENRKEDSCFFFGA
jgi:hypothetical protein